MTLFDTAAYAAEAGAAPGPGYMDLLLLVGFVGIFYFLLWRPQSKRRKEQQTLMAGLAKGDEVVTAGGIVGKVVEGRRRLHQAAGFEQRRSANSKECGRRHAAEGYVEVVGREVIRLPRTGSAR